MAEHFLMLLLGATLLQGIFSMSPVPVLEDEWKEFSRMLRNPEYRLPTTTEPFHYELSLTPYFANAPTGINPFTFDGTVNIYIQATQESVSEIVIHCNDLIIQSLSVQYERDAQVVDITVPGQTFQCEMPFSFLRILTSESLLLNQVYVIRSTFRGNLQTNMRGFYRSWYRDSSGLRWMGTTQFQPGHARQAFPCYDEPGFKATFDITMIRESDFSPTISNMPIRETIEVGNGRISETFYTTPRTSAYLLAFIVSHYDNVAAGTNTERPFDIYARNNVGNNGLWALEIGELLLNEMEEYIAFPYYTMAEHMNMKQAAIPDFSAGAMENWGLLTYREAFLLYDPDNSNHFYKQRVANIVSHEIAHMWFGNLVTCAWWDVLWLNEGFARFYQYFMTARVAPELGYETRFITEQIHMSMLIDSLDSAHPLSDPSVNDPIAVSAHFSPITYAKGASILRMTQYLLGVATYEKALRNYMQEQAYNVAQPEDLFRNLALAAADDDALDFYDGITVDTYFKSWSEQAGHPILTVTVDQRTGEMTVAQERFNLNDGYSSNQALYIIPITWTRGNAADFQNLKPVVILTDQTSVLQRGTQGLEWVIFNKQQTGYYRVNYDGTNWALLTNALRSDERTIIHEYNRANIVDDVFVLARAGILPYNRALNILSFLKFEDAYAPWDAAIVGFNFLLRRLAHDADNLRKLQDEIINLSEAVVARLGYEDRTEDSYMDGLQRMYIMQFLCNVGHPGCIDAANFFFQSWRNGVPLPPNMRPWVYCNGLREGAASDFDFFWNQYLQNDLSNDQVVMLQAAGCTGRQASLDKFLDAIADGQDTVRPQDWATALSSAVSGSESNTIMVFNWLLRNIEKANNNLGSTTTLLSNIAERLIHEPDIIEFESWITQNREFLGDGAYNAGINGATTARSNLQWSNNRIAEMALYLETGYQEDEIEEVVVTDPPITDPPITDPPITDPSVTDPPVTDPPVTDPPVTDPPVTDPPVTDPPVTDPPVTNPPVTNPPATNPPVTNPPVTNPPVTTPEPGSANIAALSFITLILTSAITFLA